MTQLRTLTRTLIPTHDSSGRSNGHLLPIYNRNDNYFADGDEPQQVYLTTILPNCGKGPHLHNIRRGWFTCIKGDIRITVKVDGGVYEEYYSGESHNYRSVEIPRGVPALLENVGSETAFVLNMPAPAWTPDMHDEHIADFSDRPR